MQINLIANTTQQISAQVIPDTVSSGQLTPPAVQQSANQLNENTRVTNREPERKIAQTIKKVIKPAQTENQEVKDTLIAKVKVKNEYEVFTLFPSISSSDSSVYNPKSTNFTFGKVENSHTSIVPKLRMENRISEKGWVFGTAMFSTLLLVIVRIYFHKHLSTIIESSVNFQFADKLLREKNVLVRRVFVLLNLNFIISASLYIYIAVRKASIGIDGIKEFYLYLLILLLFLIVLLIRLIFLYLVGNVFNSVLVFKEYIHNSYLLNKNLGLFLLPLVLSVFYLENPYSEISFYIATILIVVAYVYRYLRSLQIILKHKVLYFYTILYLCTLEILPAMVGFKFILSLR